MKVCLAPFSFLWTSYLVGHFWVFLNWALGLQDNGCDIILLETFQEKDTPEEALQRVRDLREYLTTIGLDAEVTLLFSEEQGRQLKSIKKDLEELTVPFGRALEEAEILLNFIYDISDEIISKFKRTALVDIDPGLLQLWVHEGQLNLTQHDVYFTTGETVGKPEALFPDCGLQWHYTPPAVFLPAWRSKKADSSAPYTTISNWWSNWECFQGEAFSNSKCTSFLEYLELPSKVSVPLELALYTGLKTEEQEKRLLESKGWKVRDSHDVSSTFRQYRSYIHGSRGEFSCAKPSCMRLQNAWISDRTLCYLASARPAVVQHTGPSRFLPDAEGLIRFRNFDEAVSGLASVEKEYEYHSSQALALAEEYFNAKKVSKRVLERVLEIKAKHS